MKANEHTAIIGKDVVLVPYQAEHVEKYHGWMLDEELRELTASEALTLDEEYEMQRKWREDEDKLTFIVLARQDTSKSGHKQKQDVVLRSPQGRAEIDALPMIGDVNMFFKGSPSDEDFEVEVEIMIAEKPYRRRGLASSALQLMFLYAISTRTTPLPILPKHLVVRIGDKNIPSIQMFMKLGFDITKFVEVFEEVEMRLVDPSVVFEEWWVGGEVVEYK